MGPAGGHWTLTYLLPPLLGAGIGYLTNAIAIRMLFRPFTEKRIFGIRVPFTPGVIPKYRYQLAENIGVLVSKELLSEEMLKEHILSPVFYENLSRRAGNISDVLFEKKVGELLGFIRHHKNGRVSVANPLGSEIIMSRPLSELLPVNVTALGTRLFTLLYPKIVDVLMEMLRKPSLKVRLEEEGRTFIEDVQQKLNIFQKFMISAGRYDKTLKKRMPSIVDDIIGKIGDLATDEKNVELLLLSFEKGLSDFADTPLREIEGLKNIDFKPSVRLTQSNFGKTVFALRHLRLKEIFFLEEEQKREFDKWLIHTGVEQVVKHLEDILRVIDVKGLVIDRINKLSIQDVERILLIIIEKHLTWINIFGAIIGSFIGGAQILVRLLQ